MARDDPHFRLRIPEELKQQISKFAEHNHRSLNAEIVYRLQESIDEDVRDAEAPPRKSTQFKVVQDGSGGVGFQYADEKLQRDYEAKVELDYLASILKEALGDPQAKFAITSFAQAILSIASREENPMGSNSSQ